MQEYKPFKEGKVREIYDVGDALIMVATDRISAFDVILKNKVTKKGAVLTQMSLLRLCRRNSFFNFFFYGYGFRCRYRCRSWFCHGRIISCICNYKT